CLIGHHCHSVTGAPVLWCAGPGSPATAVILRSRGQTAPGALCELPGSCLLADELKDACARNKLVLMLVLTGRAGGRRPDRLTGVNQEAGCRDARDERISAVHVAPAGPARRRCPQAVVGRGCLRCR